MMNKVIISRICIRAHQEKATVQSKEQKRLRNAAHKIFLEKIEHTLVVKAIKHHAEQVFKNAHRSKHVEEPVLRIVTVEPEITRIAIHDRPKNSRNEHCDKQHPKRAAVLLNQPTAKPRRNGIAKEKACQGPRRFIQLHAEIGDNRPREREVHQKAPPRMEHLRKPRRCAIANFRKRGQMRVAAHFEHHKHKHEKRHEKMQAVKFCNATEHERNHRDSAVGVAILACKEEARQHVENSRRKRRCRNNGHHPFAIGHVHEGVGTAQMKHDNIEARKEAQAVDSREIICGFRHFRV